MVAAPPKFCAIHPRVELKPGKTCFQCIENEEEHGNDKDITTIVYYSGADQYGRISFGMWWWSENDAMGPRWRGQMFRADPTPYLQKLRDGKKKFREVFKNSIYRKPW